MSISRKNVELLTQAITLIYVIGIITIRLLWSDKITIAILTKIFSDRIKIFNKLNATLDSYIISNKKSRDEDNSVNSTLNESCSSSILSPSSTKTNALTFSPTTDYKSTEMSILYATNSSLITLT
jgi:hypothetical protein